MTKYPFEPFLKQLIITLRIIIPLILFVVTVVNSYSNFWFYSILAILSWLTSSIVDEYISIYKGNIDKKYPIDKD